MKTCVPRREFLKTAAALSVSALATPHVLAAKSKNKRPNIIFVLADDQMPAYLSCYGGRTPTPNLDRLAREGARCTSAHAVSSLCGPSRYNILTGEFAGRNARMIEPTPPGEATVIHQDARLVPDDPCVGRLLSVQGYYTGFIGKWHSNFEITALTGERMPKYPKNPDAPDADAAFKERQRILSKALKKAGGFDYVSHVVVGNGHGPWPVTHNPEWITEGTLDFIDRAKEEGKPFFVHVAHTVPHSPNVCRVLETDPRYTLSGKMKEMPKSHPPRNTLPERLQAAGLPVSSAQVAALMLDDHIGALLKKLKEDGLDDNTMIVYAQDHGWVAKGSCYSSGTRSALLMRWPDGIRPGTVVRDHISFVDFVPTFLDMAGVQDPAGYGSDGISILPALQGKGSLPRTAIYCELGCARSVVKGRYRYIAFRPTTTQINEMKSGKEKRALDSWGRSKYSDNGSLIPYKPTFFDPDQLYDREKDPLERTNLAGDPAYAEVLADMQAELKKYTDTLPTPFPMEIDPFVKSEQYRNLIRARREFEASKDRWPGYPYEEDWEKNINWNLKSPEEVDPTHRSAWHPKSRPVMWFEED